MAAIITPTNLVVLEASTLKHPPATAEPSCPLPPLPSSLVWDAESNSIYLASVTSGIMRYDLSTGSLQDIPSTTDTSTDPITSLLAKDRGSTLVYGRAQKVFVASSQTGKVAHTFDTHKTAVTSLSLSNDSSLLASTSAHAIHVHNLTLVSHTVLRGIPSGGGSISTCAFHPHSRTRLLVGLGTQLLVYDTTRPSGPAKVVQIDKDQKNIGPIVAITCSPFSKTLVAVACSGGAIGLVDLEKEKGLFRIVQMPAPVTCLSFSAEGAALYAGTENGKFLLLDLRALDQPPKSMNVSDNGDQIIAISVQRKLKPGEARSAKSSEAAGTKPLVQRDTNKAAPAPRRVPSTASSEANKKPVETRLAGKTKPSTLSAISPRRTVTRAVSGTVQPNGSPVGRVTAGTRRLNATGTKSPLAPRAEAQKKAFSPPRSPITMDDKHDDDDDLSVPIENLLAFTRPRASASAAPLIEEAPVSAAPRAPSVSRASSQAQLGLGSRTRTHSRTASAASTQESVSSALSRARSASSASAAGSRASKPSSRTASLASARAVSPLPAPAPAPAPAQHRRVSGSSVLSRMSRTPSPDLPGTDDEGGPVTPIPAYKAKGKGKERAAQLGLGSPEVDDWAPARAGADEAGGRAQAKKDKDTNGNGGGKRVGFAGAGESDSEGSESGSEHHDEYPKVTLTQSQSASATSRLARDERGMQMQVSPRRSFAGRTPSWAPVPSPLRNPGSPQARAAQDMLQALLRDALHEFRQETKAEIVGLHLDLIRMGGSWRREMREAMGEVAEEIRELREENRALREENERLRRGY